LRRQDLLREVHVKEVPVQARRRPWITLAFSRRAGGRAGVREVWECGSRPVFSAFGDGPQLMHMLDMAALRSCAAHLERHSFPISASSTSCNGDHSHTGREPSGPALGGREKAPTVATLDEQSTSAGVAEAWRAALGRRLP
jgi:hypothetical protein